jgi:ATP-dependent RNA helicase DDX52/ROK1
MFLYRISISKTLSSMIALSRTHQVSLTLYKKLLALKYHSPTPIQSQSIPALLAKRNCVCIAPTGSGKTVAYTLPLLANLLADKKKGKGLKGLIVVPTFELSIQIYTVALQLAGKPDTPGNVGLSVKHINKMNYGDDKDKYTADFEALDLLITTPLKFLNISKLGVDLDKFEYVVLDEADKYFELGFLDQFKELIDALKLTKKHYSLFSATFPSQIEKLVVDLLIDPVQIIIRGKMVVLDTISQKLTFCGTEFGKIVEIKNLVDRGDLKIPCLIFVQSKDRAKQLYREVKSLNIPVGCIEAGMDRDRRRDIVNAFTLEKIFVLITTDLLARGLDFPKVQLVINYDMPSSTVNYIHRVGRTGRGGVRGQAITFYTGEDKPMLKVLGDLLHTSGVEVPDWIINLRKPKRNVIKQLAKRPTERDHIDQTRKTEEFFQFNRQMKMKDKEYIDRIQEGEQGIIKKGEKDPRVLMASKIKNMMAEDGGQEEV